MLGSVDLHNGLPPVGDGAPLPGNRGRVLSGPADHPAEKSRSVVLVGYRTYRPRAHSLCERGYWQHDTGPIACRCLVIRSINAMLTVVALVCELPVLLKRITEGRVYRPLFSRVGGVKLRMTRPAAASCLIGYDVPPLRPKRLSRRNAVFK